MSSQTKPYKYCIVPQCTNTTISTPNKIFICIPRGEETRKNWCIAMKRHTHSFKNKPLSSISMRHCCEDHFELENDMENYIRWKTIGGAMKIKKGVVPHIFDCQAEQKRIVEVKRHKTLVKAALQLSTIDIESKNSSCSNETQKHVMNELKKSQHANESDGRAMIASVYEFLKDEYEFMIKINSDNCDLSHLANITKRTAEATGVSPDTVIRILKEREIPKQSEKASNSNAEIIHLAIKDYLATVESLYTLFKEKKGFTGSCYTFRKILSEIDYEHSKCPMIVKKDTKISFPPNNKITTFDTDSKKRSTQDFQTKANTLFKDKKGYTGSYTEFSDALTKMGYNVCKATTAGDGSCLLKNSTEHDAKINSEKSVCSQSNLETNLKDLYCDKSSDMDTDNVPINFTSTQHSQTNTVQEENILHANLNFDTTANSESYDLTPSANIAQRTAQTTRVDTITSRILQKEGERPTTSTEFPDESTDIDTETYPINLYDIIDSKASFCIEEANMYIETDSIANIVIEEAVSEEKFIPENNDSKANIWTEIDSYKKVCSESSANLCPISPKKELENL